LFVQTRDQVNE
jgi:WhiB family transcriptional regulator, redox-sensing transcriptional regulator